MQKVNPLTATEIRLAAAQADSYPPGYGTCWGWGPLMDWLPGDPLPDAAVVQKFGGPALVIIAGRDAWETEEVEAVLLLLNALVKDYCSYLDEYPRAVADRLRGLAGEAKGGRKGLPKWRSGEPGRGRRSC